MSDMHWRKVLETYSGQLAFTWDRLPLAVLMSIRDELQTLNSIMKCRNVAKGFQALAKIADRDEKAFKRRVEHAVAKRVKRAST